MSGHDPRALPGFRKKSFALPFRGGEIWFEHLDGIYQNADLVLEKLSGDRSALSRPSYPSLIGFVLDETEITPDIIAAIADVLLHTRKTFRRVCFIGTGPAAERALKAALRGKAFALAFIRDLEQAKEWLVS